MQCICAYVWLCVRFVAGARLAMFLAMHQMQLSSSSSLSSLAAGVVVGTHMGLNIVCGPVIAGRLHCVPDISMICAYDFSTIDIYIVVSVYTIWVGQHARATRARFYEDDHIAIYSSYFCVVINNVLSRWLAQWTHRKVDGCVCVFLCVARRYVGFDGAASSSSSSSSEKRVIISVYVPISWPDGAASSHRFI